jgi:Ca2+-binding EF-hand superfamily protein
MASRLCACLAPSEQSYEPVERTGSVPGPREPPGMMRLREVVADVVDVIETGGVLSPSHTKRIWDELDANSDGSLNREELKDLVRLLWDIQGENKATIDYFKQLDTDNSSTISLAEFRSGMPEVVRKAHVAKMHRELEQRLRRRAAKGKGQNLSAQHIESAWDYLDENRDGSLTKEELEKITRVLAPRSKTDRDWAFGEIDANGDGKIEKAEFGPKVGYVLDVLHARANSGPEPQNCEQTASVACFAISGRLSEPVKRKLWRAYNVDDDHKLTKEEIAPLVYYLWEHLGEDKNVVTFFKALDKDGDDQVTEAEFMGAAEKAFAMAAEAWPRPSPAEVVASMRLYAQDLCMQYECCARIVSLCKEGSEEDEEEDGGGAAALIVAHGGIEAAVAALLAASAADAAADADGAGAEGARAQTEAAAAAADLCEESCKTLDCLLLAGSPSDDQQASASRLTKAADGGGVGALIDALVGFPDRFELQLAAVRVLGFAAQHGDQAVRDGISASKAAQAASEAKQAYHREEHARSTAADRQAVENSLAFQQAEETLLAALAAPAPAPYAGAV